MIVVTAAGGSTGTAVVRELRSRGLEVRAVVGTRPAAAGARRARGRGGRRRPGRRPRRAAAGRGRRAVPDLAELRARPRAPGRRRRSARPAAAGVGRVVYHSVLRPQLRAMPHHAAKDRAEEALDARRGAVAGAAAVRLRRQPGRRARRPPPRPASCAAPGACARRSRWSTCATSPTAAAVLLTEDGLDGGTFEAVGPDPLTAPRRRGRDGRATWAAPVTAVDTRAPGARQLRRAVPADDVRALPGARVHRQPAGAHRPAGPAAPQLRRAPATSAARTAGPWTR